MDHATAPQAAAGVQDSIGMDLTVLSEMHIVVEDTAGVERAAMADAAARPNDHPGTHMHPCPQASGGVDDSAGVHPSWGQGTGIQGPKGLGEPQPRIGQGNPGQAPLRGLALQVSLEGQQHGGGITGGECRCHGMARLQKRQLTRTRQLKGLTHQQLGIETEMARRCHPNLADFGDQIAETHSQKPARAGS
jgi:hypothetical protein